MKEHMMDTMTEKEMADYQDSQRIKADQMKDDQRRIEFVADLRRQAETAPTYKSEILLMCAQKIEDRQPLSDKLKQFLNTGMI